MENIDAVEKNVSGFECFADSSEMAELRLRILEVGIESEEFGELYGRYQELGEVMADSTSEGSGRIELMVKSAQIIEGLGLIGDAIEMLNDAYYSAQQEGLTEATDAIIKKISDLENKRG